MRLQRQSNICCVFILLAALFWPGDRSQAGPEDDPNPLPRVVACFGSRMGVGPWGVPHACSRRQGAYWFFVVEPGDYPRLAEVVYRFDVATGIVGSVRLAELSEKVQAAWETMAGDPDARSRRPGPPWQPKEISLTHSLRRFEIETRAILVQQWYDYRIHPLPWPEWNDVNRWMRELGWGASTVDYVRGLSRPPASPLGPYLRFHDRLYFGLEGGMSEGQGGFGGLAIFDLESESWELLRPKLLLTAAVTDIVTDPQRQTLWLGTVSHGEYGSYPASGLVRLDLRDRSWRAYTPENNGIPGGMVWWLRWSVGGLWVSTEKGLGRMSLEDGSWTSFLWSAERSEDGGPRFSLVATAPPRPAPEAAPSTAIRPKGRVGPGGAGAVRGTTEEETDGALFEIGR